MCTCHPLILTGLHGANQKGDLAEKVQLYRNRGSQHLETRLVRIDRKPGSLCCNLCRHTYILCNTLTVTRKWRKLTLRVVFLTLARVLLNLWRELIRNPYADPSLVFWGNGRMSISQSQLSHMKLEVHTRQLHSSEAQILKHFAIDIHTLMV